ncbi:hypothetical protein F6455_05145 [Proteobacteria bacterium 005FR1]|nr:hypothetical protein [Proteobacteria bacterium 005FR1]
MRHQRLPGNSRVLLTLSLALCLMLGSSLTLGLKPSHEADRLVLAAEQALSKSNYSEAEDYLSQARQLGIELPADYDFLYGKLLHHKKELNRARNHLEQYVNRAGKEGEHYREALALITEVERSRNGRSQNRTASGSGDGSTAELRWAEDHEEYIREIQELYQQPDAVKALTQHINSLLKFYAYGDERVIATNRPLATPSQHRIHTSDRGEIVYLSKFGRGEEVPFDEDRFPVYGIDPYIDVHCNRSTANCWLIHPITAERWLQIVENEQAAAELSKAFAQLIKRMQKGG